MLELSPASAGDSRDCQKHAKETTPQSRTETESRMIINLECPGCQSLAAALAQAEAEILEEKRRSMILKQCVSLLKATRSVKEAGK
jgi:hypothetical protein